MNIIILIIKITWFSLFLPMDKIESSYDHNKNIISMDDFYIIDHAILDSVDYSEHYRTVNGFIKFYKLSLTENIYMANVMQKVGTQSYGQITDLTKDKIDINKESIDIIKFNWHNKNTYDEDTGVARVIFYTSIKESVHKFVCMMILEDDAFSIYSGTVTELDNEKEVKP